MRATLAEGAQAAGDAGDAPGGDRAAVPAPSSPRRAGGRAVLSRRQREAGALWASGLAISGSSAVALVVLSRHLPAERLAEISSVFVLSLLVAVVPLAVQGRAAADRLRSGAASGLSGRALLAGVAAAAAASPGLAALAHLPVLAVLFPVLQLAPATVVAVTRGDLLGQGRAGPVAVSQSVEALVRGAASVGLGWTFGPVGMAAGLLLGSCAGFAGVLRHRAPPSRTLHVLSLLVALAALTAVTNVDVFGAVAVLGAERAADYSIAVLPGKAVFVTLSAAGWLLLTRSEWSSDARRATRVLAVFAAGGLALAGLATLGSRAAAALLGQPAQPLGRVAALAVAMALGGTVWAALMLLIGTSARRPWLCVVPMVLVLVTVVALAPSTDGVVLAVVLSQLVGVLGAGGAVLVALHRGATLDVTGAVAAPPAERGVADVAARLLPTPDLTPRRGVPRLVLAAVSALLVLACLVQQPGAIVAETKLNVAMTPASWLGRTFGLWVPGSDFGFVQNQAVGYLFPMGSFFLVGDSVAPVWVVQRLWIALVLIAAFWGLVRLADELVLGTRGLRVIAGLSYALSPFFIARAGNTSGLVLGGALLPWMVLPLVRASRGASPRRCGLASGVAVLAVGGINAAVALAVLVGPLMWLLTRQRSRQLVALGAWWMVGVVLGTAWWLLPLLFQSRYGFDFLPYTERAGVTTGYASNVEILRGVADWLQYLNLGVPWIRSGWELVSDALPIVVTGAVASAGVVGLCRRDLPHRRFLVGSLLAGVVIMAGGYGGTLGNPLAGPYRDLLDGAAGPFRNIYKFQPVVLLPLSLSAAHVLGVLASRLRAWRGRHAGRRTRSEIFGRGATALVAAVSLVLVVLGAAPLWKGTLTSAGGFRALPSWWQDLAGWQRTLPQDSRILVVPGATTGGYVWGQPLDEPLDVLSDRPYAVRDLVPYGSPEETRVLDAVEGAVARGGDAGLPAFLARAGITWVVARNDLDWQRWGSPRPALVDSAFARSGLVKARGFGPTLPLADQSGAVSAVTAPGQNEGGAALRERSLHALGLYEVPGGRDAVTGYPVDTAVAVSGGPDALLGLARAGLVRSDQATVLPGSGATAPPSLVVTDSLRRRVIDPGLTTASSSYTLQADQTEAAGGRQLGVRFLSAPADGREAVRVDSGDVAQVRASSYGSWLYQLPEAQPGAAVDGRGDTAWVTGASGSSQGEWVEVDLRRPLAVDGLDARLLEDGPWRPAVTALRVTTDAGSVVTPVRPDETRQHLAAVPGPTRSVRVTVESVVAPTSGQAGAGIRELSIPGVSTSSAIRVPTDDPRASTAAGSAPPTWLLTRSTVNPRDQLRRDEEQQVDRVLAAVPRDDYTLGATASAQPNPALLDLLDQVQAGAEARPTVSITASSTYGDLADYRTANLLDGNPITGWAPQPPRPGTVLALGGGEDTRRSGPALQVAPSARTTDPDPALTLRWSGARRVDRIGVTVAQGFSVPAALRLSAPSGVRVVPVQPDGTLASFAPLLTDRLRVEPVQVQTRTERNALGLVTVPVGLTALRVPALDDLTPRPLLPTTRVRVPCGQGPSVRLGATTVRFAVSATLQQITDAAPVALTPCGSAAASLAGDTELRSSAGTGAFGFRDVVVRPTAPPASHGAAAQVRSTRVLSWAADRRTVAVGAGDATYLTVAENANRGWTATLSGRPLRPVVIDGWQQAFVVPAGAAGVVTLRFAPTTGYRTALGVGLGLALLLLLLVLLPARRRARQPVRAAGPLPIVAVLAGSLVVGVWVGGWLGPIAPLLVGAVLWSDRAAGRARRLGSAAVGWCAGACVLVAALAVAAAPGTTPDVGTGAFGWPAQVAATLAIMLALATLVWERRGAPTASAAPVARSATDDQRKESR